MEWEELASHSTPETPHEVVAAASEELEAAPTPRPERIGFFDQLLQSNIARSLALMAGAAIGGGSLTFMSGCSSLKEEAQVQRALEKEAKFSTFGANARISLNEMPSYLEARSQLKDKIDDLRPLLNSITSQAEETLSVMTKSHGEAVQKIKGITPLIDKLLKEKGAEATPLQTEATQLKTAMERFAQLTSGAGGGDIKTPLDSTAYQTIHTLQTELHEWSDALERDIGMVRIGVHAKEIAELANELGSTIDHLNVFPLSTLEQSWLSGHQEEVNVVQALLKLDIKRLQETKAKPEFSSIREDLDDAEKLLTDLSKALEPGQQATFFRKDQGQAISAGQALLKEALKLVEALHGDLKKELANNIGAQDPTPGMTQTKTSPTTGGGHSIVPVHHYHMWYMPFNTFHGGYSSGYTYTPYQSYGYSGAHRLRTSPEYSSFTSAAHEAHGVVGGKEGVTSHKSGAPVRSSVHAGDSHSGASHHTHSGGSGKVGGFNTGKSFSSGFGG